MGEENGEENGLIINKEEEGAASGSTSEGSSTKVEEEEVVVTEEDNNDNINPNQVVEQVATATSTEEDDDDSDDDSDDEDAAFPLISLEERMEELVTLHDDAWLLLATRHGLPRQQAIDVTTQTAMELFLIMTQQESPMKLLQAMKDSSSSENNNDSPAKTEHKSSQEILLEKFCDQYLTNKQGAEELFHRSMFALFDTNKTGIVGKTDILKWLDHTYSVGAAMRGGRALPPRPVLETVMLKRLEEELPTKGGLTFDDIRTCVMAELKKLEVLTDASEKDFEQLSERSIRSNSSRTNRKLQQVITQDDDDQKEEWDFCAWLDQVFAGGQGNSFCAAWKKKK